MFHTPLNDVTFEQVEEFCRNFAEGIRVEYKKEPTKNIARIISSFANTVGGIWIIGVEADKTTNLPKLPIEGMERKPGVQEQITQSAQNGIYPSITPDVRVLDVPGKPDRMIVVVKVPESIEAPHAIENSTRVYVRKASTTEPYDSADLERIEYLLKRREQPEQRREVLVARMAARSWCTGLRRRVILCPLYPSGMLLPYDELFQRAERLRTMGASQHLREFRLIHEGISSLGGPGEKEFYFEANVHGIVFFEDQAKTQGYAEDEIDRTKTPFVYLQHLLVPLASALNTALVCLKGEVTNVLLRYELLGWQGIGYLPHDYSRLAHPGRTARDLQAVDGVITVSVPTVLETLPERRVTVLTEVMRQVLWAFNVKHTDLATRVTQILQVRDLM